MSLIDVLSIEEDVAEVKVALNTAMITLTAAATQLALVSLERSGDVLDSAFNSEPVIGSFAKIADAKKFAALSRQAMVSADAMVSFLCAANENLDDDVNASYTAYLEGIVDNGPIDAILAEGERKITLAFQSLPPTLLHASRFDGSVYISTGDPNGS